ncbi:MAG TPA: class I SAM-dependent methyltransferase [Candidatus Omnitrophota bacterium]|nr:class I SAM-dependent methyltransferase [Candidatus Omnitrophota bacterium]
MSADKNSDDAIRSDPAPNCSICGEKGVLLYSKLHDRLFGSNGVWSMNQCPNIDCGTLWLDPCPYEEDMGKAYQNYITHGKEALSLKKENTLKTLVLCFLRALNVISLERIDRIYMYIKNLKPGRLLEVGCGNGEKLSLMKKRGWQVVGQEVDPIAAQNARSKYHCEIHVGPLEKIQFKSDSFDAIILNHVIEHLHHPIDTLKECRRILKKGGAIVAATPNTKSFGHAYFGRDWAGIDVPRHIHIFSPQSLRKMAEKTGFNNYKSWSTAVFSALLGRISFDIKNGNDSPMGNPSILSTLKALVYKLWCVIKIMVDKDSGEECVLLIRK